MRVVGFTKAGLAFLLFLALPALAVAQDNEIEDIRSAIEELRSDYEARISDLERRLAVAEQNSTQAVHAAQQAQSVSSQPADSGNSAFNPAIGVVFQGFLTGNDGEAQDEEGFAVGETELIMSANVDDKFAAYLTAALAFEDGESELEVEEAWVETTAMPAGFSARFGRMFSGIGYLNAKHSHTWDFADQALPYQAFLDGRYVDNGVQLRWLAPTDLYVEIGGEIMQGEDDPSGLGASSVFKAAAGSQARPTSILTQRRACPWRISSGSGRHRVTGRNGTSYSRRSILNAEPRARKRAGTRRPYTSHSSAGVLARVQMRWTWTEMILAATRS
jgi:hypothetical protein